MIIDLYWVLSCYVSNITVMYYTTYVPAPEEADPIDNYPWKCDFGPFPSEEDLCGFTQPAGFMLLWQIHSGQTGTAGTGPTSDYISGLPPPPFALFH